MATEKVFTIRVDGVNKQIKNVEELKNSVQDLEKRFESAQFGTPQFKELQSALAKSKARVRELDEATDGLTGQQKIEAFASIGEAITSAFAVGTVIESFIGESEELAKVQEKVEKALLLVMAARAIAEGVKSASLLRNNALQAVSTTQTVAATVATGALTATTTSATAAVTLFGRAVQFALGPVGLIIGSVGALIGLYFALAESAEEAAEKQSLLNKQLNDTFTEGINQAHLQALLNISKITDDTARATATLNEEERNLNVTRELSSKRQRQLLDDILTFLLSEEKLKEANEELLKLQNEDIINQTKLEEITRQRTKSISEQTKEIKKLNAEALKKQLELFQKLADIEEQTRTDTENARIQSFRESNQNELANKIELQQKLRKLDIEFNKQFLENLNNPEILAALQKQKETEGGIITRSYNKTLDRVQTTNDKILEESKKGLTDFSNSIFGAVAATVEGINNENEKNAKKSLDEILKDVQEFTDKASQVANAALGLAQNLANIANQNAQNQIAQLDKQLENTQEKLDGINQNFEESISNQQDLEDKLAEASIENRGAIIAAINTEKKQRKSLLEQQRFAQQEVKRIAEEKKQLQIQEFNRNKALSLAGTVVSGAQAVVTALGTPPPGIGQIIAAAIVGASVAAQIALIASQQPPQFKAGGFTSQGQANEPAGIVHKGEWVAPKWMVDSPTYQPVIHTLENNRHKGFAAGGFTSPTSISGNDKILDILTQTINALEAQSNRPLVVSVQEIENKSKNVNRVKARASL